MAKYARIENGRVTNVIEWDGETAFKDSDLYVALSDGAYVGPGFVAHDDGTYGEPPEWSNPPVGDP